MDRAVNLREAFAHRLARILYWISIILLLCGMRVLINPFNRRPGEIPHIYFTLITFEIYMWLLLLLGRWQKRNGLITDMVRSGLFTLLLIGFWYIVYNELILASSTIAYIFLPLTLVLAVIKLPVAGRWLDLHLPRPIFIYACLWLVMLALPTPVIFSFSPNHSGENIAAYLVCWLVALFIGAHIPLVAWQIRRGRVNGPGPLGRWWTPWLVLAALAVQTIWQLYSALWLLAQWEPWYLTPVYLALAVVALCLAEGTGKHLVPAGLLMAAAVTHAAIFYHVPVPKDVAAAWTSEVVHAVSDPNALSDSWMASTTQGFGNFFLHPIVPAGVYLTILFAYACLLIRRMWMLLACLTTPVGAALAKAACALYRSPNG
ncbi:MAG: hypothetical protein JW860_09100, partial [Sedimentisphaerales bacterium]|nr:hypothetical protein [Sedimentisphaerales bacterium]